MPARPSQPETLLTAQDPGVAGGGDKGERFEVAGRSVYLIGIGGCGMSGLARMLATRGAAVSGSDLSPQESTDALMADGIAVGFDQAKEWLPERCDLVVASAAVKADHPQMRAAASRGIPVLNYAQTLGKAMLGRTGIAVAGTHGKSSTTAMLGTVLVDAGLDPTVIVGATSRQLRLGNIGSNRAVHGANAGGGGDVGGGFRLGANRIPAGKAAGAPGILVAEACEYTRSFHNLRPTIASISSVEADHLDCYKDIGEIVESFRAFAGLLPKESEGGRLLIAHDGAHRREVTAGLTCRVETIGFSPQADWVVSYEPEHRRVKLSYDRKQVAHWTMRVPGAHMAFNAASAVAMATMVGAEPALAAASMCEFRGIDRRMQLLGERPAGLGGGSVRVYDDYGHHPTEIDVTLRALRDFERPQDGGGRLICVFQPHQHSRTRHLLDEFAQSFSSADVVIVPDIYFVRDTEAERQSVTAADLVDRLRGRGVRAMHMHPFEAIVEQLETLCRGGDLLVVMGAGPVYKIGQAFLRAGGTA